MARSTVTKRTAERLIRAAYDFEELANRMKAEGYGDFGRGIEDIARRLGNIGRDLDRRFDQAA